MDEKSRIDETIMNSGLDLKSNQKNINSSPLERLEWVMDSLRGEPGCPWDKKQTHESLIPYILEESYELIDAIQSQDIQNLKEELGDVLFQVVFHSRLQKEKNNFNLSDVFNSVSDKLIYRHPHVFGSMENHENLVKVQSEKEVIENWEKLKEKEKGKKESSMDGIPKSMDGVSQALKIQSRAAKDGFDWDTDEGVLDKIREEIQEIQESQPSNLEMELGDLFFTLINLSRHWKIDPNNAIKLSNDKFMNRYRNMESFAKKEGKIFSELSLDEKEILWNQVKRDESK